MAKKDSIAIPTKGAARSEWFRAELQKHLIPGTKRPYTQADIAEAVNCHESMVSFVYMGRRKSGPTTEKIQAYTAKVLGVPVLKLFGHICDECSTCGSPHTPRRIAG